MTLKICFTPLRFFYVVLFTIILTSCSTNEYSQEKIQLQLLVSDPDRIRFSGKGAGAGMMLMSSMGATGIAIGIAIDEGIGQKIAATATLNNIDYIKFIESNFLNKLHKYNLQSPAPVISAKLDIKRYGFILSRGENDPVTSEYIIRYQLGDNQWQSFHFPKDLKEDIDLSTKPLEEIKIDGQAINDLINDGLQYLKISNNGK